MTRLPRTICLGVIFSLGVWMAGCAPTAPVPPPPSTPVVLSTVAQAAGTWSGILRTIPRSRNDDWLTLTIRENGTYHFESVRTIGIMQGDGTFTVLDGRLRMDKEGAWITGQLYADDSRRRLTIEAESKDGVHYAADLAPGK